MSGRAVGKGSECAESWRGLGCLRSWVGALIRAKIIIKYNSTNAQSTETLPPNRKMTALVSQFIGTHQSLEPFHYTIWPQVSSRAFSMPIPLKIAYTYSFYKLNAVGLESYRSYRICVQSYMKRSEGTSLQDPQVEQHMRIQGEDAHQVGNATEDPLLNTDEDAGNVHAQPGQSHQQPSSENAMQSPGLQDPEATPVPNDCADQNSHPSSPGQNEEQPTQPFKEVAPEEVAYCSNCLSPNLQIVDEGRCYKCYVSARQPAWKKYETAVASAIIAYLMTLVWLFLRD